VPSGFTPLQIRFAYGIDSISYNGLIGDGYGQTIAIVSAYDDPRLVSTGDPNFGSSDLHQFDAAFGIPDPPNFTKLAQDGSNHYPTPSSYWSAADAADVEWAHAIAPGARIDLVEANSNSLFDELHNLDSNARGALDTARNLPGVSVVMMTFWSNDANGNANEYSREKEFDNLLTTPSGHQGITFLAPTGDTGTPGGYPAYSPNVVAVGGTSLTLLAGGPPNAYVSEAGWSESAGGISTIEPQPSYQSGVVNNFSAVARTVPDVSFDADPNTGYDVLDSMNGPASNGYVYVNGFTGIAAANWEGLIAIADQIRVANNLTTLDGPSQTLPGLYKLPASDFNDPIHGSNANYSAAPGYDLVTGLGTPIANKLVTDLAGVPGSPLVNATQLVADGAGNLYGAFPGLGVWEWNASASHWVVLTPSNASLLAVNATATLVGEFPGSGVWQWTPSSGTWTQLTTANASLLAVDGNSNVYADFPGFGLDVHAAGSNGWSLLNGIDATVLAVSSNGYVVATFGGTYHNVGEYIPGVGWTQVWNTPAALLAVDSGGNVYADFTGYGVEKYTLNSGGWTVLNGTDASTLVIDASGELLASFAGYGVGRYTSSGWTTLSATPATFLAGDSNGDVFGQFTGYGIQEWNASTQSWSRLFNRS
jgi:subtilase family serine protease